MYGRVRFCNCVCMCICVYTHAYTKRCVLLVLLVLLVSAAFGMSCQIYVSISTCVFRDYVCLRLFCRRMATCPCIVRQPRKVGCKWWPRCWRHSRLAPAQQIRYEEGNLGCNGVCVACVCAVWKTASSMHHSRSYKLKSDMCIHVLCVCTCVRLCAFF